jgi:hypothetical protein
VPQPAPRSRARHGGSLCLRSLALAAALVLVGWTVPATPARAVETADGAGSPPVGVSAGLAAHGTVQPTIQYDEAMAHAGDKIVFAPGERVTVPFRPRVGDRWPVGDGAPRTLPAGRMTGRAMRTPDSPAVLWPATPSPGPAGEPVGAADVPYVDPLAALHGELAAAVDRGGLKREVFGFLPYWELTDSSTRLDWEKLSTIAYFGVGAAGNGNL